MKLPHLAGVCFLVCAALALWAQKIPEPNGQVSSDHVTSAPVTSNGEEQTRITLDVTRVNILFTVTDKKGRFVTDLRQDDFQIFENKKP
jgi:hypothetical protein